MKLQDALRTRKTTRCYDDRPVPAEVITCLLDLAITAPSACNKRGWKAILVENKDDFEWLFRSGGSSVLHSAKQALIICYQSATDNSEWNDNIQSAAAFIAYFQLAAHDYGIGSCWICHLPPKREIVSYFNIPASYTPVAVVSFGYYKEGFGTTEKILQPFDRILARDRWDFDGKNAVDGFSGRYRLRKIVRTLYYRLPHRNWLRGLAGKYEKKFDGD